MTPLVPLAATEISPERIAAEIRRRFPGVWAWLGKATGHWWALARDRADRHRLVEASSPAELVRRLEDLARSPSPQPSAEVRLPHAAARAAAPSAPASHGRFGHRVR